ncbi:methylated-DNA--[protein]-cysteine S-methyltransferase [Planococcaceae bacterium Storch 2/2-2]|nr:methylated-DNA--[protein]-cysteine S-methyltransferase [Planococcaceae bacterium Storch 2/2-2]
MMNEKERDAMYEQTYDTPFGRWVIQTVNRRITWMAPEMVERTRFAERETTLMKVAAAQMIDYMEGNRSSIDVPVAVEGTDFQVEVYEATRVIPYAETRSYQQISAYLGRPKATQAVGRALSNNRILLAIPCHRVIYTNGQTGEYVGGAALKQALLRHERANVRV